MKTIISLLCVLLFNKYGINKSILKLRNEKDRDVAIISGGPSARDILINRPFLLKNTDLIVVNYFGNTDLFFNYKPKYYILLDPAFFDKQYVNKGLGEEGDDNSRPEDLKLLVNFEKVNWPMVLFLPYWKGKTKSYSKKLINHNITIVEFHTTRIEGYEWFRNWMFRHNQGLPSSRNVIIPALMLMANIGYKKLYLYGCEFSWTKTMDVNLENGKMFFNDNHFYSKEEIRYFGKGGYKWWLEAIVEMLNATDQIAKYAKLMEVDIVNRTKGSFIDSFEYENPDTIKNYRYGS